MINNEGKNNNNIENQNEQSIEQSNLILNAMFNAMPDSVYCKDLDGRYIECNNSFEEFIANPKEDIIGKTFSELVTDQLDIVKFYTDVDTTVINEKKTVIQKDVKMTYNGADRYYDLIKTPIMKKNTDGEDEIFGLVALMHDVNERYLLIKDLQHVQANLEVALERSNSGSRAKSDFLSRMSHELLTPMNAIIGMSQIAKTSDDIDYVKKCIDEIYSSSNHLLRLIKNLLEVSGGSGVLNESVFSLKSLLQNINQRITPYLDNKQQKLNIIYDNSLPNEVYSDERRIDRVIFHILTNASKFSGKNTEISLDFSMKSNTPEGFILCISITDQGIGMSDELLHTIFDMFEQGDGSNTRKYQGVGIGLTLSKYIVETMGGTIEVDSQPDKGSKFTVSIPISRE